MRVSRVHKQAILLFLVACRSAPAHDAAPLSHRQVAASEAEREVETAIEGIVIDAKTREAVEGATIVATPVGRTTGYTDTSYDDGKYRIDVPAGAYHGRVYLGDAEVPLADVDVKAGEVARWDVELDHALVERVGEETAPSCPAGAGQAVASARQVEELVHDILERFVQEPASIADGEMLMGRDVIYVDADVGDQTRLTPAALPRGRSMAFVVKTRAELQQIADLTGTQVRYISISSAEIIGDCATVGVGVDILQPASKRAISVCSCSSIDLYGKRDGKWQFKVSAFQMCG
ncbi:MAG: carboxypeptidase regulatory-like domain-containing protein [Kofleriaceae bacterium]|nr:carboxypeptidase regulatory-like domain-containing protein [Kofleriaceae bacterium]